MRAMRALPIGLCLLALSACSSAPPPFRPVADLKQLMANIVEPAADGYWDAVGSVVDAGGVTEFQPASAEDWDQVRSYAYTVTESGNLMMMSSRARDGGDWMQLSQALIEVGQKAVRAAEARNAQGVFDTGAELYDACTNCHAKYAVELQRPNAGQ
jgi:hypothetical protein